MSSSEGKQPDSPAVLNRAGTAVLKKEQIENASSPCPSPGGSPAVSPRGSPGSNEETESGFWYSRPGHMVYWEEDGDTVNLERFDLMKRQITAQVQARDHFAFPKQLSIKCTRAYPLPNYEPIRGYVEKWITDTKEKMEANPNMVVYLKEGGTQLKKEVQAFGRCIWTVLRDIGAEEYSTLIPSNLPRNNASYYEGELRTWVQNIPGNCMKEVTTENVVTWVMGVFVDDSFTVELAGGNEVSEDMRLHHFADQAGRAGISSFWEPILDSIVDLIWVFHEGPTAAEQLVFTPAQTSTEELRNKIRLFLTLQACLIFQAILVWQVNFQIDNVDLRCEKSMKAVIKLAVLDEAATDLHFNWGCLPVQKGHLFTSRQRTSRQRTRQIIDPTPTKKKTRIAFTDS